MHQLNADNFSIPTIVGNDRTITCIIHFFSKRKHTKHKEKIITYEAAKTNMLNNQNDHKFTHFIQMVEILT